jgi:hypothetical protein
LLPALVNRLDDDDVAVRLYTIVALEKMTGQRLGYEYAAGRGERQEAVAQWRRYIEQRALAIEGGVESDADRIGAPIENSSDTQSAG